jgi:mono/diheme cytochrome c family protein
MRVMASLKAMTVSLFGVRRRVTVVSVAAAAGLFMVASPVAAQAPFDLSDAARIAKGKSRFGANCAAYCHGAEGVGGRAPSMKGNPNFSAEVAYKAIAEGRRSGSDVMPPWGNAFSPEQIWELVAYLRFLSQQPVP